MNIPPERHTVLLVQESLLLRLLSRCCLQAAGFRVLEADTVEGAVRLVNGCTSAIHLVIVDSEELLDQLRECLQLELKMLVVSGSQPNIGVMATQEIQGVELQQALV